MNFQNVVDEATDLGVMVSDARPVDGRIAFRIGGRGGVIESWMFPLEGRLWGGYNGVEKTFGTKAKVADWCLDRAVNGPCV